MAKTTTKDVTYGAGGSNLKGYLATPETPNGAGVVVVHEWWGLNDYIRGRAIQLAALGFTALAADMYGDGATGDDPAQANQLMTAVLSNIGSGEARFAAAVDVLRGEAGVEPGKIAAIGYCFGGAIVLHAARTGMPLAGVVSFHGSLGSFHTPAAGTVKAKILVCHGAADALVPAADVAGFKKEMDAAGADYEFIAYAGALHGFTNPDATANGQKYGLPLAYDAAVDQQSWQDMRDFFAKIF
jgi:dienelactone hydrolase